MAISDSEYQAWLNSPTANRCVAVVAMHSAGTVRVANRRYIDKNNTVYPGRLIGSVDVSIEYGGRSIGEISIANDNGDLDNWISYRFRGYSLKVYLGDVDWADFNDFRLQAAVINAGIRIPSKGRLSFSAAGNQNLLNKSIGSETAPVLFGRCENITPVLTNSATLTYTISDTALQAIHAVRDNGKLLSAPSDYTTDLANAQFTLTTSPVGEITCDAQALVTSFGDITTNICDRLGLSVDANNITNYPNNATLGVFVKTQTAGKAIIDDLLKDVGGHYTYSAGGLMQVIRLELATASELAIGPGDIKQNSLKLQQTQDPVQRYWYGYKRNWTIQSKDALAASVSLVDKEAYSNEYEVTYVDNALTDYPMAEDERIDSAFYYAADAVAECVRRAAIRNSERQVWQITCFLKGAQVYLGQSITVTYPEFDFKNGKLCKVIGIRKLLGQKQVVLTLWV